MYHFSKKIKKNAKHRCIQCLVLLWRYRIPNIEFIALCVMEPSPLSLDQYDFIGNVRVCHSSTGDFLKHHVLSPDGLYILVSSESNYMTSWKIPIDNYSSYFYHKSVHDSLAVIESVHSSPELTSAHSIGESIYDFDWYPQMSSAIPSTSCFIVSSRDHPIHMWDQLTGI